MGTFNNQLLSSWEIFATQLRSIDIKHSMCVLSKQDKQTCRDAIVLWAMLSWDTLLFTSFECHTDFRRDDEPVHRRVFKDSIIAALKTRPIDELIDALKERDEKLLEIIEGSGRCYDLQLNLWSRQFRKGFKWVGEACRHALSADGYGHIKCVASLHQMCAYLTRLNLEISSLESDALASWLDRQSSIASRPVISYDGLREIIEQWFDESPFAYRPYGQHGKGSSYLADLDKCDDTMFRKYQHSCWSPRIRYVDAHFFDGKSLHPYGYTSRTEPPSKLSFVPKSYKKLRSIAMEDPGKMWVQQIGMRSIDDWLLHHSVLSRKIRLHESFHNTIAAQEGSRTGCFATIDLSNASDDVSWRLVKACFRRTPLYPILLAGRTGSVKLPDGRTSELHSAFTMGSALCFPVECLVFAAIVAETIQSHGHDPRRQTFFIYGDDIVVGSEYASDVVERLIHYGFTPNKEKTFSGDGVYRFRESCGGEFLNGSDVTPVRISRLFAGLPLEGKATPQQYEATVDVANDLFERYPTARRFCINRLMELPQRLRPLFHEDSGEGLISRSPTNMHLLRDERRSSDYQRSMWIHGQVESRQLDTERNLFVPEWMDTIRYEHWWTLYGFDHYPVTDNHLTARVSTVIKSTPIVLRSTRSRSSNASRKRR